MRPLHRTAVKSLRRTWKRLIGSFAGRRRDDDLVREIESHIAMQTEDNLRLGMPPAEARRRAVLKFGGVEAAKELYREQRGLPAFDLLRLDLRYAWRQLRRAPGFAFVVVLMLALGIGANTAIFSAMNVALLRLLPVRDAERLVYLNTTVSYGTQSGDGDTSLTEYTFEKLRAERRVFSDLVAFAPLGIYKVAARYGREPEEAQIDMVSGDFFSGLGVRAVLGRTFNLEDEARHAPLAVLSHGYWTRRLGRDPAVIGQRYDVKGVPFTIIGVAAPEFVGVEHGVGTDAWIPLQESAALKPWGEAPDLRLSLYGSSRNWWCLKLIGRLAPGVGEQQALARLGPVFERAALADVGPLGPHDQRPQLYFTSARGIEGIRTDFERPLSVLMVMVGLVLLIASANIAMLIAARNAARQREFSLRMALGGSRARLFRQLLTESLLLVLAGGGLGWVFAAWTSRALGAWSGLDVSLAPDHTVLAFTAAVSLATGLFLGLAPLRGVVSMPIAVALKAGGATAAAAAHRYRPAPRKGQAIVALQISLCLTLLVGAGLLLQTLRNLQAVNLGVRTSGLLVFGLGPQPREHSDAAAVRFFQAALERVRSLPGVESATLMMHRLGSGWSSNGGVIVDGVKPTAPAGLRFNVVGPDYLHVLGTPILAGRDINAADSALAPRVAIVDQTFARVFLKDQNPLGHQLAFPGPSAARPFTIVGLAANSKYTGVREEERPTAYLPFTQARGISTMHVELRTAGDPARLLPSVRRAMLAFAPDLPLLRPMTQREQFEQSFSLGRLLARLSLFFGLLAVLLVATGLYGTLAYRVSRRTSELGVRMAVGARRGQVLWMVLRGSLAVSAAGLAAGAPLAVAGARALRALLYGVAPGDPWIFAAAAGGVLAVALAAAYVPARRAAAVDPMVALRAE